MRAFSLPVLRGRRAGFSAAVVLNASQILFAATVEDTDNEIDDGATLGSFIGLMERDETWRVPWVIPVEAHGEIAPVKIEGIACQAFADAQCKIFAVTDADGEPSEMLEIDIQ